MTKQKDLKRLVRARMRKTGESYTTARSVLVARRAAPGAAPAAAPLRPAAAAPIQPVPAVPAADFAKLAGMSDASVAKATGCTWAKWVKALDHHGAAQMSHAGIAQLVHDKYRVRPWWTQMVAVGYERIRGLREKGQQHTGRYAVNKSRTFAVPVAELYAAFAPARLLRWLAGPTPRLGKAQPNRSVRMKWEDGTTVAIGFAPKGERKSQAALGHEGFTTRAQAERMRTYWTERFAALAAELGA